MNAKLSRTNGFLYKLSLCSKEDDGVSVLCTVLLPYDIWKFVWSLTSNNLDSIFRLQKKVSES